MTFPFNHPTVAETDRRERPRSSPRLDQFYRLLQDGHTRQEACAVMGIRTTSIPSMIRRLRQIHGEHGVLVPHHKSDPRPEQLRPIPDDFAALAPTLSKQAALKRWRVAFSTLQRWEQETGSMCQRYLRPMRQPPENWAALCAEHTTAELIRILKMDRKVINRIASETGIAPKPYKAPPRPDARKAARAITVRPNLGQMGMTRVFHGDNRVKSLWDEAADTLRAERWTVYRCNDRGAYDVKGKFWRAGNAILTPDELLRRADKYRRRAA